ncbi:MAG: sugar transferase [Myxococcota bacterium]|nr:sugar transferase [Myxococcota bacterium]
MHEFARSNPVKRAIDIAVASIATFCLLPVALVVTIALVLRLGRPVLFSDRRIGLGGRPIAVPKFRTMLDLRDAEGRLLPDDQRLTPFGRFLRSLSVDELPQLISVLKGDMSLVGPRPLPVRYLGRFSAQQARRHEAKPGITGLAQVSGRNLLSWEEKFALDVHYVDNWSAWLDLKIIVQTPLLVFRRAGNEAPGEATAKEFMGSGDSTRSLKREADGPGGRECDPIRGLG